MIRGFARLVLATTIALGATAIAPTVGQMAVAGEDQAALQADLDFAQAVAKSDKAAVGKLLDNDFTWTDSEGNSFKRPEVLESLPKSGLTDENSASRRTHAYGQAVAVIVNHGKVYALRIWVKRSAGWKALAYHEVTLKEQPSGSSGSGVKDCENPCKGIPYKPKNEAEQEIVRSWQALETGVTAHDSAAWAPHVADEFTMLSSNNDHPLSKADRMATLDKQKQTGVGSAPAPLVSAEMFDFGDAVIMKCLHQPFTGKPVRVTRVWIKRDGKWVMSISYQTTVQAAAAKG
jgi:ketosteroid isomerase-like protein